MSSMTRSEALDVVHDLDDQPRSVTEWEANFLDSLLKQADSPTWTPTVNQVKILKEMQAKYL